MGSAFGELACNALMSSAFGHQSLFFVPPVSGL
jgi:hypothetical protein